jgi:hypothetical protein
MKKILFCLLFPIVIFAQTYMAKIQPYEMYTLYAQTSGEIVYADKNDETKIVSKVLIKLDDSLEKNKLKLYKEQLRFYNEKLKLFEKNYKKFLKISGKSQYEKDEKYYDVLDLKISINSLKVSIAEFEDTIAKKSLHVKNRYIKEINVNIGDYVATGAQLGVAYDTSKSKLIVYASKEDYENIKNKEVFIDGQKGIAKIEKIDETVDENYVSAHKITLVLKNNSFGKVVSVEFK